MNFGNEALRLASLGYRVFPCVPGEKRPLTEHGCLDASSDEDQVSAWWDRWPEANIGVSTDGLLVVDVDPLDGGARNTWVDDLDRHASLALSAVSITPRGGTHYWFAQPFGAELRNTTSAIATNVDTRANGGYVLVSPSRTKDGLYQWAPWLSLDCGPHDLAIAPQWLVDELSGDKARRVNVLTESGRIVGGVRNDTLTSLGGRLRRFGFSQNEIAATLHAANNDRCVPPLDPSEVDAIAASVARYEPDPISTLVAEGAFAPDMAPADPEPPVELPECVLQPGGLLGEIIDYNLATAHRRQPELALAGALALMSAITGRKIQDDRRTRTNLYILGLAESGAGKERSREVNKEILALSDPHSSHLGPEGIGSAQGIVKALSARQSLLFQLDEFGRVLGTLKNAAKAPHLSAVPATLLRLYSSSKSVYISDAVVHADRVLTIEQPHCVVYGTTVPKSFFDALTPDSLRDGFVSRLLVIEASNHLPPKQAVSHQPVPASIVEQVRWWIDHKPSGNISDITGAARTLTCEPGAEAAFAELEATVEQHIRQSGEIRELWVRVAEQARKLALLFRVSGVPDAETIDESSARSGVALALNLTRRIAWLAKRHVAESVVEDQCKRVLRIIADSTEGLTSSDLTRRTFWLRKRERQEVLETLMDSGQIYVSKLEGRTKPTTVWKATGV